MKELVPTERRTWEMGWLIRGFNGPVVRARKRKGITQLDLAKVIGVSGYHIQGLEQLTRRPNDGLRANVADFLGLHPQDVWPDWLEPRGKPLRAIGYQAVDAKTYSMLDAGVRKEVLALPAAGRPDDQIRMDMVKEKLETVMRSLTARQQQVLRLRFGMNDDERIYTYKEAAGILRITTHRVRQIEIHALNKLRTGHRVKQLEPAVMEVFDSEICACGKLMRVARFCHHCGVQGCGQCLTRKRIGGKYVFLCERHRPAST